MNNFYKGRRELAFWKGLSKPRYNNSLFAPLSPAQGDKLCLDTKFDKSQGCIPLCYPSFKILNKIELSRFIGIRQNFVFNGFCAEGQRSRNVRPINRPVKRNLFGLSSTDRRLFFGNALGFLRDMFDKCSTAVRQSFDCSSTTSRRTVEAHPKKTRSCPEAVSNESRSGLEQFSKNNRRNGLLFTQILRGLQVRFMYGGGTVVLLQSYWSPTKVVGRRYWRGTKEVLNAYGLVPPQYNRSRSVVQPAADYTESTVKSLRLIAYRLMLKIKCLQPIAYGLLLIFVSMFSLSDAWAQSAESRAAERQTIDTIGHRIIPFTKESVIKRVSANPNYDLVTYPLQNYEIDRRLIKGISLGQSIPEEVWGMPLRVVRADGSEDTCTLRTFNNDKFLILDFWTTWCQPCVASVVKWEKIVAQNSDKVQLVNVHLDFDYKVKPFLADRSWVSPTVIGMGAYLLNAHFFTEDSFGKIVWVKSGKLYAISNAGQLSEAELEAIVRGEVDHIESNMDAVYGF